MMALRVLSSLLLIPLFTSVAAARRADKECGEVHLRTAASQWNHSSEVAKIGGFEWGLEVQHMRTGCDYAKFVCGYAGMTSWVRWAQPLSDNAKCRTEVTVRIEEPIRGGLFYKNVYAVTHTTTFNNATKNFSVIFPLEHSWHERYISAQICVLRDEPRLTNFSQPSRDRKFRLVVGNDTFYVNLGYLATLSPMIADHAHHPDHDFLGGELPLSNHLAASDVEQFLHVVYPSEKSISASNIESVLTVNMIFGIRSVWEDCDDFLWETDELPLSQRLHLADRFGRESVFNRLLTLLRGNEDVKDIVVMQFTTGAVRKVLATIAALNFDVKWEHVFA